MKAGILLISIILVSIAITSFLIIKGKSPLKGKSTSTNTLNATVIQYKDPLYKFTFSYPTFLHLEKHTESIILTDPTSSEQKIISSVATSSSGLTLSRQTLLNLCKRVINSACLIESQAVFTNINGVTGNSYYFKPASRSAFFNTSVYGPVYAFTLPLLSGRMGMLFFYPDQLKSNIKEDDLLKKILETLILPIVSPSPLPPKTPGIPQSASSSAK